MPANRISGRTGCECIATTRVAQPKTVHVCALPPCHVLRARAKSNTLSERTNFNYPEPTLASPFQNIWKLSLGDFVSKALYFLAFIYLARALGVAAYGVLEFANAIMVYLLLLGEAGLDRWGIRGVAQAPEPAALAAQMLPLRLAVAVAAYGILLACLPFFPAYPQLRPLLLIFGLMLFAQVWNLKWVFIGRQEMARVSAGLVLYQAFFALSVFALVRSGEDLLRAAGLRLLSEILLAGFFAAAFFSRYGPIRFSLDRSVIRTHIRPALAMGAAQFLSLLSYNFDAILIGFLLTDKHVGWYGAAYKPVTVALAIPITYFLGYYSVLAGTFAQNTEEFAALVKRSLRLTSIFAVPLGIGAALLAEPLILFLYGEEYAPAIPVLQVLAWSAALVILRGNYRHALHAAGQQNVDLRFSVLATGTNIVLNILWIPRFGMIGAAWATLVSEVLWLMVSWLGYHQRVGKASLLIHLWRPLVAGAVMGLSLWWGWPTSWMARGLAASLLYFVLLWVLREPEVLRWVNVVLRKNISAD
jgi:O-antigen/teichoic acid export membrane protein